MKKELKEYFKMMKKNNLCEYHFIFRGDMVSLFLHNKNLEIKVKNNSYIFQFSKRWTYKKLFNLLMEEFN